jgi:uncharacterized protein (UPF0335 family)
MVSGQQLLAYAERIEQARKEKKAKGSLEAEIFAEAKGNGYEIVALKNILKKRAQTPSARSEQEAIEELYMAAMGMASAPLFAHVAGGSDPVAREARIASLEQQCPMDGEIMMRGPGGLSLWVKRNKDGVTVEAAPDRVWSPQGTPDPAAPAEDPVIDPDIDIDDVGARELGREARKNDVAIVKNPYPFGDERRRLWDEGWRSEDGGSGFGKR